jgi:hypothetical protein
MFIAKIAPARNRVIDELGDVNDLLPKIMQTKAKIPNPKNRTKRLPAVFFIMFSAS